MKKLKSFLSTFSLGEKLLWSLSSMVILLSFLIFDRVNYLTLAASLIGVTSLIFDAKGHHFGQILMVAFSLLYGLISYRFAYYGEMITYLAMTAPMAMVAYDSWKKNPFGEGNTEVKVNQISGAEHCFMWGLAVVVTGLFYFILDGFGTANLIPSTISVATSFVAVYLTFRRSPYYALGYAANDIVLILLWILASIENPTYICVVVCFAAFLVNDCYAFICWKRMERRQAIAAKLA